jgi:hypothetical protein
MPPENGYPFAAIYDSPYEAIEKSIASSGKTKKELASILYPGSDLNTAKSLFSRALNPENRDVNLSVENILSIMQETRPEDFLFFLCDLFGFERPARRTKESFKCEIQSHLKAIQEEMRIIGHRIEKIGD